MALPAGLRVGTSSWSTASWRGVFYSDKCRAGNYISEYSRVFDTVEIDSTFYGTPRPATVQGWKEKTPDGFLFAAKAPRVITHEKVLVDCEDEVRAFLRVMDLLEDRLGPILFQFPYFNRKAFPNADGFIERLKRFVASLPEGRRYAVEVRNKGWVTERLLGPLRERGIAFCLIDHPWMTRVDEIHRRVNPVTADFSYIRFIGDRHEIEAETQDWDRLIWDRTEDMDLWTPIIQDILNKGVHNVFVYFNNHYAGHAPGSVREFRNAWRRFLSR